MNRKIRIVNEDILTMQVLLDVFDHITFNDDGEMMGIAVIEFPMFGKLRISYYVRECSLAVWRDGGSLHVKQDRVWMGTLDEMPDSRDKLVEWLKGKIREQVATALA